MKLLEIDRNSGPLIDLGGGPGEDLNITFIENGPSIPIVHPHLLSITDEENHNISRLTVELIANGDLDPTDAIFLRSPLALQFIDYFQNRPTTRLLDISLNATTETYKNIVQSIFYDNNENEPTLFNRNGSTLIREVIITIYDNNFRRNDYLNTNYDDVIGVSRISVRIMIQSINDNRPQILIRAEPDECGQSSVVNGAVRRRRDIRTGASIMKKRSSVPEDTSMVRFN